MYGLLSKSYNKYRITQEGYNRKQDNTCMFIELFEAMITVFVIIAVFDIFLAEKMEVTYLGLLLFSFYIPVIGDIAALAVLVYWIMNIQQRSVLFSK